MRQLVVTSGKGGTGKTVTASFVTLPWMVIADADGAPNQHLLPSSGNEKVMRAQKFC